MMGKKVIIMAPADVNAVSSNSICENFNNLSFSQLVINAIESNMHTSADTHRRCGTKLKFWRRKRAKIADALYMNAQRHSIGPLT